MTRVPITGMGIVAPGAIGVEALRELLAAGRGAVEPVDRFDTSGLSAHAAALVLDLNAKQFIAPMKLRRMNMPSRFALSAARMALDDCGALPPENTGVALGTAFGPVQTSVEYMQEYVARGAALAPPQLFAESVANAPGSHIAIEHNLRGFNVTITLRESSALAAAELPPADIDAVFASANGTKRLDAAEARAIAQLFSCDVVATKAYFGEHAGGNALQIAAAVLAVYDQTLPASAGFEERDEA